MNRTCMSINDYFDSIKGCTVAFGGIGISNAPVAEMFLRRGFRVILCDRCRTAGENDTLMRLHTDGAELRLGEDYLDGLDADIFFRSPGLNWNDPALSALRERGTVITSETELFFRVCPAHTIAVTGSCGKTTVSTIIARMLEAAGKKVWLGGGIGRAMLPDAEMMSPDDWAVCELSSFHLISMHESPDIALITNISPNHLDTHRDMDEYVSAMGNICAHQSASDRVIVNGDCPVCLGLAEGQRGQLMTFSHMCRPDRGAYADSDGDIWLIDGSGERRIMSVRDIRVPGMHNVENFLAAICATAGLVSDKDILSVAHLFCGVSHRTEFVRCLDGVCYYNDSIATTPERTVRGMLSLFDRRIVLIAGGYDKKLPFDTLAQAACERVSTLILIGATADAIEQAVRACEAYDPAATVILRADSMEQAVRTAAHSARDGDIVALSPACASLDMYRNYEERGSVFIREVMKLRTETASHQDDDEDYLA